MAKNVFVSVFFYFIHNLHLKLHHYHLTAAIQLSVFEASLSISEQAFVDSMIFSLSDY